MKKYMFLSLLNKNKRNSFHLLRNPGFLLIIIGWGESGEVILQVSIAVFRVLLKTFCAKMAQPPRKNWPMSMYTVSQKKTRQL